MSLDKAWKSVLGQLEVTLSKANFTTWFAHTELVDFKDGIVTLSVPSVFVREWIKNKYAKDLKESLAKQIEGLVDINYIIGHKVEAPVTPAEEAAKKEAQKNEERPGVVEKTRDLLLNPKFSFENFVVGSSNRLAHAACVAVAETPGKTYNPLFLYGGVGLGKTHLIQAIGNEVLRANPKKKVMYVSSEKFTTEFIQSVQSGKANEFKNLYRNCDLLLVDDIQFLAGKEGTQEEFFHTFNTLYQNTKQIVISSDRPPKAISGLEDRLVSRFEWGLIADIQPPDYETRIAILRSKAEERGYKIEPAVFEIIAREVQKNIRELEGALNRIAAHCDLNGTVITPENAAEIIGVTFTHPKAKTLAPQKIIKTVASFYGLRVEDLTGSKRDAQIVKPRQIAMYLLREEIGFSYPKTALALGGRDHTTCMHGVTKITKELKDNEVLLQELNEIRKRFYQ